MEHRRSLSILVFLITWSGILLHVNSRTVPAGQGSQVAFVPLNKPGWNPEDANNNAGKKSPPAWDDDGNGTTTPLPDPKTTTPSWSNATTPPSIGQPWGGKATTTPSFWDPKTTTPSWEEVHGEVISEGTGPGLRQRPSPLKVDMPSKKQQTKGKSASATAATSQAAGVAVSQTEVGVPITYDTKDSPQSPDSQVPISTVDVQPVVAQTGTNAGTESGGPSTWPSTRFPESLQIGIGTMTFDPRVEEVGTPVDEIPPSREELLSLAIVKNGVKVDIPFEAPPFGSKAANSDPNPKPTPVAKGLVKKAPVETNVVDTVPQPPVPVESVPVAQPQLPEPAIASPKFTKEALPPPPPPPFGTVQGAPVQFGPPPPFETASGPVVRMGNVEPPQELSTAPQAVPVNLGSIISEQAKAIHGTVPAVPAYFGEISFQEGQKEAIAPPAGEPSPPSADTTLTNTETALPTDAGTSGMGDTLSEGLPVGFGLQRAAFLPEMPPVVVPQPGTDGVAAVQTRSITRPASSKGVGIPLVDLSEKAVQGLPIDFGEQTLDDGYSVHDQQVQTNGLPVEVSVPVEPSPAQPFVGQAQPPVDPAQPTVDQFVDPAQPSVDQFVDPAPPSVDQFVDPAQPPVDQFVEPAQPPTDPSVYPAQPLADPAQPPADPAQPPVDQFVDPAQATVDPAQPHVDQFVDPAQPPADPAQPHVDQFVDSAQPPVDPAQPHVDDDVDPAEPPVDDFVDQAQPPVDQFVDPAQPPVDDFVDPAQPPVDQFVDPAQPPVDPAQPPVDPAQPPVDQFVDPAQPPVDQFVDPSQPQVDQSVYPAQPPVDQFVEPAQPPTDPSVDPKQPLADPSQPPADPAQPPVDQFVDQAQPYVDPAQPPVDQAQPHVDDFVDPAQPSVDPAQPPVDQFVDQAQPSVDPAQPSVDSSQPHVDDFVDPAQPSVDPAQPSVVPAQPPVDPAQPHVDPAQPHVDDFVDPAQPYVDPAQPSVVPAQPSVDPAQPHVDAFVDPAQPSVDPAQPYVDPAQQLVDHFVDPEQPSVDPAQQFVDHFVDPAQPPVDEFVDPAQPAVDPAQPHVDPAQSATSQPVPDPAQPSYLGIPIDIEAQTDFIVDLLSSDQLQPSADLGQPRIVSSLPQEPVPSSVVGVSVDLPTPDSTKPHVAGIAVNLETTDFASGVPSMVPELPSVGLLNQSPVGLPTDSAVQEEGAVSGVLSADGASVDVRPDTAAAGIGAQVKDSDFLNSQPQLPPTEYAGDTTDATGTQIKDSGFPDPQLEPPSPVDTSISVPPAPIFEQPQEPQIAPQDVPHKDSAFVAIGGAQQLQVSAFPNYQPEQPLAVDPPRTAQEPIVFDPPQRPDVSGVPAQAVGAQEAGGLMVPMNSQIEVELGGSFQDPTYHSEFAQPIVSSTGIGQSWSNVDALEVAVVQLTEPTTTTTTTKATTTTTTTTAAPTTTTILPATTTTVKPTTTLSPIMRRLEAMAALLRSRGIPVEIDEFGKLQFIDDKTTTPKAATTTPSPTTTTTATTTITSTTTATTTTMALTETSTALSGTEIEALCENPSYIDSVGYAGYPGQCNKVVQCFKMRGGKIYALVRECPYGLFWESSLNLCKHPAAVESCYDDPCTDFELWDYKRGKSCRAYSECYRGMSYPQCCQKGFEYRSDAGCVPNAACQDPCETPETITQKLQYSSCKFLPDSVNPFGYQTLEHDGVRFRACAPGTMFSEAQCGCVAISSRVRQRQGMRPRGGRRQRPMIGQAVVKNVCMPDFYMNFNEDIFKETSGTRTAYGITNVMLNNGAAEFKGKGNIILWGFMDRDLGREFAVRFRFKTDANRSPGNILSNCGMHGDPTVSIRVDKLFVVFLIKTLGRPEATVIRMPYKSNDWNDVVLYYNGDQIICGMNDRKTRRPLSGEIETRSNAIYVGGCPNEGSGFEGLLDEISIYSTCIPQVSLMSTNSVKPVLNSSLNNGRM